MVHGILKVLPIKGMYVEWEFKKFLSKRAFSISLKLSHCLFQSNTQQFYIIFFFYQIPVKLNSHVSTINTLTQKDPQRHKSIKPVKKKRSRVSRSLSSTKHTRLSCWVLCICSGVQTSKEATDEQEKSIASARCQIYLHKLSRLTSKFRNVTLEPSHFVLFYL